jgi:signal transduction histidine kinase
MATAVHNSFLSESGFQALSFLRRTNRLPESLDTLSPSDKFYLEAELCVRRGSYAALESVPTDGVSALVLELGRTYRNLFTNPAQALASIEALEQMDALPFDVVRRIQFWKTHLKLLTGSLSQGYALLELCEASLCESGPWYLEEQAIVSLGYYLAGYTEKSLNLHLRTQDLIDADKDLFIQTFNSAMAMRAALKSGDSRSFEFFNAKLEESIGDGAEGRYRLRHTAYRAMIFNQLGSPKLAGDYWKIGDALIQSSQSALENAQYLLLRGLAHAIVGEAVEAKDVLAKARQAVELAGNPDSYRADIEAADLLAEVASPFVRSVSIGKTGRELQTLLKKFSDLHEKATLQASRMIYDEAKRYVFDLIEGVPVQTGATLSLVISILKNVDKTASFASEISSFNVYANFLSTLRKSDLSAASLQSALEEQLHVKTELASGAFKLPTTLSVLSERPEVAKLLDLATTLLELSSRSEALTKAQRIIEEQKRSLNLAHDLRFITGRLAKLADEPECRSEDLRNLAGGLDMILESHLDLVRKGNRDRWTLVVLDDLLLEVCTEVESVLARKVSLSLPSEQTLLWTSDLDLKRALRNLIKNACEASESGRAPLVTLKRSVDGNVLSSSISIRNVGGSLPRSIFAQATRGEQSEGSKKSDGTGLGLSSSVECLGRIGARLEYPKDETQATELQIELPVIELYGPTHEVDWLVIDDQAGVLEAWKAFAGKQSKTLVGVRAGEEAPKFLNGIMTVQWLICDFDLKLSNVNGAKVSAFLKKKNPTARLALATGFEFSELPEEARNIGWDALLGKDPQDPSAISAMPSRARPLRPTRDSADEIRRIRHDIKNALSPLMPVCKFLDGLDGSSVENISIYRKLIHQGVKELKVTLEWSGLESMRKETQS